MSFNAINNKFTALVAPSNNLTGRANRLASAPGLTNGIVNNVTASNREYWQQPDGPLEAIAAIYDVLMGREINVALNISGNVSLSGAGDLGISGNLAVSGPTTTVQALTTVGDINTGVGIIHTTAITTGQGYLKGSELRLDELPASGVKFEDNYFDTLLAKTYKRSIYADAGDVNIRSLDTDAAIDLFNAGSGVDPKGSIVFGSSDAKSFGFGFRGALAIGNVSNPSSVPSIFIGKSLASGTSALGETSIISESLITDAFTASSISIGDINNNPGLPSTRDVRIKIGSGALFSSSGYFDFLVNGVSIFKVEENNGGVPHSNLTAGSLTLTGSFNTGSISVNGQATINGSLMSGGTAVFSGPLFSVSSSMIMLGTGSAIVMSTMAGVNLLNIGQNAGSKIGLINDSVNSSNYMYSESGSIRVLGGTDPSVANTSEVILEFKDHLSGNGGISWGPDFDTGSRVLLQALPTGEVVTRTVPANMNSTSGSYGSFKIPYFDKAAGYPDFTTSLLADAAIRGLDIATPGSMFFVDLQWPLGVGTTIEKVLAVKDLTGPGYKTSVFA